MNILFITNYSKNYGGGHFIRCNKLSKKLKKNNKIFFLIDDKDKNTSKFLTKDAKLIINNNIFTNIKELIDILKNLKRPIVVIDSYLSSYSFEKKIYPFCKKLIVIDDLKKKHFCDIYINPNLINFKFASQIKAKIKLLGIKYSFLDISRNFKKIKKKKNKFKNILIFMGATDSKNFSHKIYKAIKEKDSSNLKFKLIKGYQNENLKQLIENNKLANFKFLNFSNNFLRNLYKTDVFISSGGSSVWESVFLRKKTLIFNHSHKQFENSTNLEKKGLVKQFRKKLTSKNISNFLISEINSKNKNSYKYKNLLDSYGLDRIKKIILQ